MRLFPVLDLMNGQVVRGVAGRRDEYRPIQSRLTTSAYPLDVARAFQDHFGLTDLYVADLDAIAGGPPALGVLAALQTLGFRLAVDVGLRQARDAAPLSAIGVATVVAGLETLAGPAALEDLLAQIGADRLLFSLDLKDGQPLGGAPWAGSDAWEVAHQAVARGVRRLLVLDLARVGVSAGTGTEGVCARLAAAYGEVEILAGGGVRGPEDLDRLRRCGVKGVLVASALHDGKLGRQDVVGI
jgi:phosphoribosylformimino-5-aminoimidazole carboxamide ribotide isomerase